MVHAAVRASERNDKITARAPQNRREPLARRSPGISYYHVRIIQSSFSKVRGIEVGKRK